MSDLHEVVKNIDRDGLLVSILLHYILDGWTEDEVDEVIVYEENADEEFTFVMGDAEHIQDQMPDCYFADRIVSHRQDSPDDAVVLSIIKHNKDETTDFGCISVKKEFFKNSVRRMSYVINN